MAMPNTPQGPMPAGAPPMAQTPDPRGGADIEIPGTQALAQAAQSAIQRTPPDIPESRRLGVAALLNEVTLDKAHWKNDFEQMRKDMDFARGWQWPDQTGWDDERYIANIVQRHVNQRVSALYAKNPTFTASRREPRHLQVRNIDARDQEDERHCPEQDQQQRPC